MAVNNLNSGVGIQPTIVDAKGDLIAATANDAVNRLAVGTNGQVLVADSGETTGLKWNNPGTVGGLVHIKTESTGGAVSSVTVNDCFNATYNTYRIIFDLTASTSNAFCQLRLRVSGADTSSSIYKRQITQSSGSTVGGIRDTQTGWLPAPQFENGKTVSNLFEIFNPFESVATSAFYPAMDSITGNIVNSLIVYGIDNSLSYTGFSVIPNLGTINGTITVLGYRK